MNIEITLKKKQTVIHYKNPRRPKRTICGHDSTISGKTYSNVTNRMEKVNCKACLNAIRNNKLMREIYSKELLWKIIER